MRVPEAYLRATRRLRGDFVSRDYYAALFDNVRKSFSALGMTEGFYATFSTERTCETVRSQAGTVIIYDQYLGQSFNHLNRIWLNADSEEDVLVYAWKVMAERAQIKGHLAMAAALATAYRVQQPRAVSYRQDVDLKRRNTITFVQEMYVLSHEAMHSVFERDPEWLAQAIGDARRDFLTNYFLPRVIEVERSFPPEEVEVAAKAMLEQMELFARDDALVEECVCDTMAVAGLWHSLVDRNKLDSGAVRSGIFFALRHLRLLAFIRSHADHLCGEAQPEGWLNHYVCRTQFLQWMMRQFEPLSALHSTDAADADFIVEQQRYEYFLDDPILFELPARLDRDRIASTVEHLPQDFDALNRLIDDLLMPRELTEALEQVGEAAMTFPLDISEEALNARKDQVWKILKPDR